MSNNNSEPLSDTKKESLKKNLKRKVREGEDGLSKTKRRRLNYNQAEKESGSASSADTGNGSSSTQSSRCGTTVEDVSKRTGKRKAAADEEEPCAKRRKGRPTMKDLIDSRRAEFEAKYQQENHLGEGGCGCVFAGYRKEDHLPVAIKHIAKDKVLCKERRNGKELSAEVAVMLKLQAGRTGLMEESAPVSLLDWYDLDQELILVLERPMPCMDLLNYIRTNRGHLQEDKAKIILKQLVDAANELEDKRIFHRDIKPENILIETSSDVPRVRVIDFGLSCFFKKTSVYRVFCGTPQHVPPEWYSHYTYRPGPTTVWQMGVVLYELLHRTVRFDTTSFLKHELPISDELSRDCQDFLQKCLNTSYMLRPTLKELQLHPWLR
uniref:serine/threonine-protein kinase pim-1-like n=2 Tax=Scatophagus argus TaxID=75038 RepID=UPI001ED8544B|nr:serine/threonine-protein kinase pim-1-like [Scatophagus argus]XP_046272536.1 serine/threonine-protein kinase pim-1-like [Scatophagus argus]